MVFLFARCEINRVLSLLCPHCSLPTELALSVVRLASQEICEGRVWFTAVSEAVITRAVVKHGNMWSSGSPQPAARRVSRLRDKTPVLVRQTRNVADQETQAGRIAQSQAIHTM